jgi:hypothetical protein
VAGSSGFLAPGKRSRVLSKHPIALCIVDHCIAHVATLSAGSNLVNSARTGFVLHSTNAGHTWDVDTTLAGMFAQELDLAADGIARGLEEEGESQSLSK